MGSGERKDRRFFSEEFKLEAVRLVRERGASGVSAAQVSRELGISPQMLSIWKKRLESTGSERGAANVLGNGKLMSQDEELRHLRREVEVMRQERDFLRKAAAFFAKESR